MIMSESQEVETIELPADTVSRVDDRVARTEFDDVSGYVQYILEEILYHAEQENDLSDTEAVDEQEIQDRLKSLGYLNE